VRIASGQTKERHEVWTNIRKKTRLLGARGGGPSKRMPHAQKLKNQKRGGDRDKMKARAALLGSFVRWLEGRGVH